jgi:hypothetical protein
MECEQCAQFAVAKKMPILIDEIEAPMPERTGEYELHASVAAQKGNIGQVVVALRELITHSAPNLRS